MTSHHSILRRRSRRSLLRATAAAGIAVGVGRPATSAPHSAAAADATPAPVDGLAQTPLGDQLAWFLAAVNGGGTALTEAEVAAHFAPTFLAVVPPAQLIGLIQGLAGGYGALTLQGTTRPPTATQAVGLVAAAVGLQLALPITVEDATPHRITGLNVYPVPSADGDADPPDAGKRCGERGDRALRRYRRATALPRGRGQRRADGRAGGRSDRFGRTWSGVIPALAAFTRVVSYDRPNTIAGASDPAPMPRTAADVVADLHALLDAAAVPGPYVLVGHSVGGLFVRLFASRYPDEVAGLVLVDASHEEQDVRRQDMVSADLFAAEQQAVHANTEGIDLNASFAQVRAGPRRRPTALDAAGRPQRRPSRIPRGSRRAGRWRRRRSCTTSCKRIWRDSSPVAGASSPSRAGTTSSRASPTWWSRRSGTWSRAVRDPDALGNTHERNARLVNRQDARNSRDRGQVAVACRSWAIVGGDRPPGGGRHDGTEA